jgi:cell division protein FtsB
MKKISFVLLLFLMSIIFTGCNGEEVDAKLDEMQDKIASLESQLLDLDKAYSDLETALATLDPINADFQSRIANLETQRNQLIIRIQTLEDQLAKLTGSIVEEEVKLFLPDKYYLVPNDNFQLFYRSIIQAVNPYIYHIKLTGTVGHAYNRYFEWKPTTADDGNTFTLKIDIRDNNGNILGSGTTQLIVSSANKNEPTKNILCIGDSLTVNGVWVQQGTKRYAEAGGGTINVLGTVTSSSVRHEGRGGWQWVSFINGYTSSIPSPFKKNSGTGISFKDYCTNNGYSHIDELYILMSYNGIGGSFKTFSMTEEPFKSAKILIDQFHQDFPNGKVTLLGIPQPSVNGGLGAYYNINQSYGDNYGQFVTVLNYNKQLENFAKDPNYASFVRYVDVKGQFDSEYNMPTEGKKVNNQNNTTEPVGNAMGIHPSNNGYMQIGDAFYRALCHEWK